MYICIEQVYSKQVVYRKNNHQVSLQMGEREGTKINEISSSKVSALIEKWRSDGKYMDGNCILKWFSMEKEILFSRLLC